MVSRRLNIFGSTLEKCSEKLLTGFTRNGCCDYTISDTGKHIICAEMTKSFLLFSLSKGNDLITPNLKFNFHGLKEGDRWCICLNRWLESYKEQCAPKIILSSTDIEVIKFIEIDILKKFALDLN